MKRLMEEIKSELAFYRRQPEIPLVLWPAYIYVIVRYLSL
jgi:hypothetical protein